MLKLLKLRLTAVAGGVTLGFGLSELMPWLQVPSFWATFFLWEPQYTTVVLGASAWLLLYVTYRRNFGRTQQLSEREQRRLAQHVMSSAELSEGAGLIIVSADERILEVNELPLRLIEHAVPSAHTRDPRGRLLTEVYVPRLAQFFRQLLQQAQTARKTAIAEIEDWSLYSDHSFGHTRVSACPSFDERGYCGALLVFRNLAEVKLLQSAASQAKQDFRLLFDNLPYSVAIFKPAPGTLPGTEISLLEYNAAFQQLFAGLYDPPTTLAEFVRYDFLRMPELRDGMAQLLVQGDRVRFQFFQPIMSRHIDVTLARFTEGRFLALVHDYTEQELYAEQVLQLNDQLRITVGQQRAHLVTWMEDRDRFIEAAADQVASCLDKAIPQSDPLHPCAQVAISALQNLAWQLVEYSGTASLPYGQSELVSTRDLLQRLLESYRLQRSDVAWDTEALPWLMASPVVLEEVLRRLLDRLLRLPLQSGVLTARLEISGYSEFLNSGLRLGVTGLDVTGLLLEVPEQMQALDWTLSGDLDLATVRRIITTHGGTLSVGPWADGGVLIAFSLGTPNWST